ncbi:MAG TPA: FtsX-like permease family protein, partial [Longimicrobiales bacterium]|nr:FtsX-like permease family protein [Longimicrobiales bacterium]
LLLSLAGGAVGLALGRWALRVVPALPLFPYGAVPDLELDHRVLLFTGALVLVTGVAFGLAPGVRSARTVPGDALRQSRGSSSPGRVTTLHRNTLVAIQVAVSLVLLVGAGLAGRSFLATQHVETGVDAGRVAYLGTRFGGDGVSPAEAAVVASQIRERLEALPGVTAVGFTTRLPVEGGGSTTTVVEDYHPPTGTGSVELPFAVVGGDYLQAMGIPLVAGRTFGPRDTPGADTVVLVSEAAALRFWNGTDEALGRRVRPQSAPDQWREVVGVVGDVKVSSLQEPQRPMMYLSANQYRPGLGYFVARTAGDPDALLEPMRRTLEVVGPALPLDELKTLDAHFGEALVLPRMAAALLGAFSAVAVLLATLGIYAVVSFAVVRRTGELGIRIALGAARARVVRTVVGGVLLTVGVGLLAGLGLALLAAPRAEDLLYGVPGLDPLSFGATVLLLVTVSALAAYLPARRAAGADPVEALRAR